MLLYKNKLPNIKSYVNFIATSKNDYCFTCKIIDYNLDGILPLNLVSSKKKIKSFNKLIPLNKNLVGIVDNIDKNMITLNLVYMDKNSFEYKNYLKLNINNNKLFKICKRYCFKFNKNLDIFWDDILNINNDDKLEFVIKNLKIFDKNFKSFFLENIKEKVYTKIEHKIGLITLVNIEIFKKEINDIIKNEKYNLTIKLDKLPIYKIESNNNNDINCFKNKLRENFKNNNNVFIKFFDTD